jgi:hypothetical protein
MKKTEKLIEREENDRRDSNRNGIDDRFEPPIPDVSAGTHQLAERLSENHGMDPSLSGGDIDAQWEMAESQGVSQRPNRTTRLRSARPWGSPTPTTKS